MAGTKMLKTTQSGLRNKSVTNEPVAGLRRPAGLWGYIVYHVLFCYFLFLLPLIQRDKSELAFRRLIRRALRISFRTFGIEVRVEGARYLNAKSNAVIIANHTSWFDQLALLYALDLPIAFVANRKYFRYFGVGHVLNRIGGVSVEPGQSLECLRRCRDLIQDGKWLVIFPEGTRSDSLRDFHRGTAVLVEQTGSDVQPIVISGAREVLPRRQSLRLVQPGQICLTILPRVRRSPEDSSREFMTKLESSFRSRTGEADMEGNSVTRLDVEDEASRSVRAAPQGVAPSGSGNDSCLQTAIQGVGEFMVPRNSWGLFYLSFALTGTALAIVLSLQLDWKLWLIGQMLLSLFFLQWLAILHEAGHKTLMKTRRLNRAAAWLAGFFALIPGDCWRTVHARHHHWTGWQDLDMTTESLVPRPLAWYEKLVMNICWLFWIPLFATMYRIGNYWNLLRLRRLFPREDDRRRLMWNIVAYAMLYLSLVCLIGWKTCLWLFLPATYMTLMMQDLLILSQHTHIPMEISGDLEVRAFAPREQAVFTRSLIFPRWFARLFLLNFDAHGLHHEFPRVPGYYLHQMDTQSLPNCIPWWKWIWAAKRTRADVLLFQNRNQTGFEF